MNKEDMIQEIVSKELNDFLTTVDLDGKARCQEFPENFIVSRFCQWFTFEEGILQSYLDDLNLYQDKGRNIVTDKYAYMMEYQGLTEESDIINQLPTISDQKKILTHQLVTRMLEWTTEADAVIEIGEYLPKRPLRKSDESGKITSTETYLTGEYYTYSEETLIRMLNYFIACDQKGINIVLKNYDLLASF